MHSEIFDGLDQLFQGQSLSKALSREIFSSIVKGQLNDVLIASLITALKMKGESAEEIAGAAQALVDNASAFPRPDYAFADIVGTGGDNQNTINISSAAAIVAASCGVAVAKHGNKSVSSRSGSADLFAEFGVQLNMNASKARRCLDTTNLCFLFAPHYHTGVKNVMQVRTQLKTRSIFNLLGPLINPAQPTHIVMGVYAENLVLPIAKTLQLLGYQSALVVHGEGLDELALHGTSTVAEIRQNQITQLSLTPEDFGLARYPLEAIKGGEPQENMQMIKDVLQGKGQAAHEAAIALNAAALLKLTGKAHSYSLGADMAIKAMRDGVAFNTIQQCAKISAEPEHD